MEGTCKKDKGNIELELKISVHDLRVLPSVYKQLTTDFPSSQNTQ